jgi:hypothetical protein
MYKKILQPFRSGQIRFFLSISRDRAGRGGREALLLHLPHLPRCFKKTFDIL